MWNEWNKVTEQFSQKNTDWGKCYCLETFPSSNMRGGTLKWKNTLQLFRATLSTDVSKQKMGGQEEHVGWRVTKAIFQDLSSVEENHFDICLFSTVLVYFNVIRGSSPDWFCADLCIFSCAKFVCGAVLCKCCSTNMIPIGLMGTL